jgi:hypothetical protein
MSNYLSLVRDFGLNIGAGGIVAAVMETSPGLAVNDLRVGFVGLYFVVIGLVIALGCQYLISKPKDSIQLNSKP